MRLFFVCAIVAAAVISIHFRVSKKETPGHGLSLLGGILLFEAVIGALLLIILIIQIFIEPLKLISTYQFSHTYLAFFIEHYFERVFASLSGVIAGSLLAWWVWRTETVSELPIEIKRHSFYGLGVAFAIVLLIIANINYQHYKRLIAPFRSVSVAGLSFEIQDGSRPADAAPVHPHTGRSTNNHIESNSLIIDPPLASADMLIRLYQIYISMPVTAQNLFLNSQILKAEYISKINNQPAEFRNDTFHSILRRVVQPLVSCHIGLSRQLQTQHLISAILDIKRYIQAIILGFENDAIREEHRLRFISSIKKLSEFNLAGLQMRERSFGTTLNDQCQSFSRLLADIDDTLEHDDKSYPNALTAIMEVGESDVEREVFLQQFISVAQGLSNCSPYWLQAAWGAGLKRVSAMSRMAA